MKENEIKLGIKSWADADKPREKLLLQGRRALSEAELIAILIGSGSKTETAVDLSKRILHRFQNQLDILSKLGVKELKEFKGIGEAKAITIIAALELGRRRKESKSQELPVISDSNDVFELLRPFYEDLPHEEFWILLLNRGNRVTHKALVSKGGISETIVDPRIIFKIALEHQACSIILTHNHPSGNLNASEADIKLTKKLKEAGQLLDIAILDHLIFSNHGYLSFRDENLL